MEITIQTDTEIDVICKQRELVKEALGADGVYIRMKDTVEDLLNTGGFCFGTSLLRIHNGTASIWFRHHHCTQGAPPEQDGTHHGPFYVVSTHVLY